MAKIDENSFFFNPFFGQFRVLTREKKLDFGYRFQRGSTSTIIIASWRTRAYWFWFISCIMSGNIHLEILWSKMIFFPLLVFVPSVVLTFVVKRIKSIHHRVDLMSPHWGSICQLSLISISIALTRDFLALCEQWFCFWEFILVFLLKRDFWGNILYIWSKVFKK